MKLLVINQFASTPAYTSGAGERFYYLSKYFKQAQYQTKIIAGGYNHLFLNLPETPHLFNEERIPGAKMVWIKMRPYSSKSFMGRFLSWFEFLFKLYKYPVKKSTAPDISIVSSMSIFPIFYALYLKRYFGTKVILEIRDIWPLTPIELGGYSRSNLFIRIMLWVEKYAYKNADKIVSVLPGFSRHVENTLGKEIDVTWIPNACSPETLLKPKKSDEALVLDKGKFNIFYAGSMGIANAMEYVIGAAKLLKSKNDINFILVGDGPEKEALKAQSANLSNVLFLPKIPKEQLHNLVSQSDITIISWRKSKLYDYGVSANKYNDYMLASKPIISASNIKDDPVILSGAGIQAEAENPNSIAMAIKKLYEMSPVERSELGKKGKEFVLAYQTYKVIAKKYIQTINEVRSLIK